jgi:acyl carrier protein
MTQTISSSTPEGRPNHCPVCGAEVHVEPSLESRDAPCPNCGTLLWFFPTSVGLRFHESKRIAPIREKVLQIICDNLGVNRAAITPASSFFDDIGADSLDTVEFVMALEKEFGVDIADEDTDKIKTVGDLIDYLARRIT